VGDLRAALLACADDEHLREAALDLAVEVGVGLDPVDRDDGVGPDSVAVRDDGTSRSGVRPTSVTDMLDRISQPTVASVTPSSASISVCPVAVAPPWLPIAGKTKGS